VRGANVPCAVGGVLDPADRHAGRRLVPGPWSLASAEANVAPDPIGDLMKTVIPFALVLVASAFAAPIVSRSPSAASGRPPAQVSYPEGFRRWTHVRSALVNPRGPTQQKGDGMHHIYANELAMKGYDTGRFPDGAVIVFDLFDVVPKGTAITQGARRYINVMQKDSARFAATGGWGFEEFGPGDGRERSLSEAAQGQCAACHMTRKEQDMVFSVYKP
jgi:cytochrome P460